MIKLSASAIKDWMVCPQRYYWRVNLPEEAILSPAMYAGEIVHSLIEKYWNDTDIVRKAVKEIENLTGNANQKATIADKVLSSIKNFENYKYLLDETDAIEYYFELPIDKEVIMVGVMDRVVFKNNIIIDWKTSKDTPRSLDKDPQFLIYNWAYKKIFNKIPASVMLINLYNNNTSHFGNEYQKAEEILFNNIIPIMIREIRANRFQFTGVFNGGCYWCSYKQVCMPKEKSETSFVPGEEDYEH